MATLAGQLQRVQLDGAGEEAFSYQSLMQELLMALLGYTGDVFVDASDVRCVSHPYLGPQGWRSQGQSCLLATHGLASLCCRRSPSRPLSPSACNIKMASDIGWIEDRDRCAALPGRAHGRWALPCRRACRLTMR